MSSQWEYGLGATLLGMNRQWASCTKYPNIIVRSSCVAPCLSLRLDTDPHSTGLNLQKPEVCYL